MSHDVPHSRSRVLAHFIFVRFPYLVGGTLVLIAIAVNFANVIARYVFASAIFWTEEVLVFLMLWSVFLAAVTIAFKGEHINMDIFLERFSRPWKQFVSGSVAVVFISCCAFLVWQSWQVVTLHLMNGTRSVAAGVPMILPHTALLVGFSLMGLAVAYRFRAYLRGTFD